MKIRDGYLVFGIILIGVGIFMPSYLYSEALVPVTFPPPAGPQPPSSECAVVTATITGANGTTHRSYNVTCPETLAISAILGASNATLPPSVQNLLSNVSYAISVISTLATVAVALAVLPLQGEHRAKLNSGTMFFATFFLSMAVVLALFMMLAVPLRAIPTAYQLPVMLLMLACTLVGYGFSVISWGSLRAQHSIEVQVSELTKRLCSESSKGIYAEPEAQVVPTTTTATKVTKPRTPATTRIKARRMPSGKKAARARRKTEWKV